MVRYIPILFFLNPSIRYYPHLTILLLAGERDVHRQSQLYHWLQDMRLCMILNLSKRNHRARLTAEVSYFTVDMII